jgi:cytochrome d ubiquinol oxidase subunit I
MDSLGPARAQMALSLAFHMVFAAAGIALPLLMLIAEGLWLRTSRPHYLQLAKKWAKATGLLFVVGAVSGTALSFELGLLWPWFMERTGSIIGPAFALEGFAFFLEAIFLGLYLYGWDRLSPLAHWLTGVPVAVSGLVSGILVVAVNAWMQAPVGFDLDATGHLINIDPWGTFRSPYWIPMSIHSSLSCYVAVCYAVAGVYAVGMLYGRREPYHRSALAIAMAVGTITALLQPVSGDLSGRMVAKYQPVKLAAMEAHFHTQAGAPLILGGIPNADGDGVRFGIEIPRGLSLLAFHDPNAVVVGLNDFPISERPNVLWVHVAFQIMVISGTLLIALGLWYWWTRWRRGDALGTGLLRGLTVGAPLGFLALEAGWFVTELGRQPWTVFHILRTSDAVTPVNDVSSSLLIFTVLYLGLAVALVFLLLQLARPASGDAASQSKEAAHGS